MYNDIDFFQFQKRFSTEKRCINYLLKLRWANGFICPKCGHKDGYFIKTRYLYQCKSCKHQVSVTAGTVFHKTQIPLRKWFWMIFLITQSKHSYSVAGLQRLLNIATYNTAWSMAQKIRKAMSDRDSNYKLSGIIEMDDSYFGTFRASGTRGRGAAKKSKVIVSVQLNKYDKPVFARMNVVPAVSEKNVAQTANQVIRTGSIVNTDGWRSYHTLTEHDFQHNRLIIGDPKMASKLLPWVHTIIANCKGVLRGTHHGVSSKHLHYYLSEFCYKFNRRFEPLKMFDRIITACLLSKTVTFAELIE